MYILRLYTTIACEKRLALVHSPLQVCIPLFLPLVINTTPQAVARSCPCNTTHLNTSFALQAGEVVGGAIGVIERAAFKELTQR